jgi:hypothetical protein
MKNTTKKLNQEDMSDIIKVKPANTTAAPVPVVNAPANMEAPGKTPATTTTTTTTAPAAKP